ncbi:hypothetical protein PAXINDRAFT_99349 [Paxillus involutus ATCC 200175]|uniref:Uncharacterized protein n=1 Tax=Paxillus involutus ATCC 200175 TaxID=664439 RepID=A0A0C9SZA1_PAXIN|nr:hypothetical protein PAXINDRAFT_99349 [Paxillus involutus ATCC 200175]
MSPVHSEYLQEPAQSFLVGRYRAPDTLHPKVALQAHPENASSDLCASLVGKRIAMIGGEHVYLLHKLLLQHRERAERKAFPCLYREFCTHHQVCLPPAIMPFDDPSANDPPRFIKSPTAQQLIETGSALLSYIISDTLFSSPDESSWEYSVPFLDPTTGVRLHETYWLAAARKANIVVLGRGPISTPGQTYAGNWSFLHDLPDYIDKTTGRTETPSTAQTPHERLRTVPRPLEVVNAAVHVTVSRFLPDLLQVLRSIRQEVRPGKRRLIWAGSWYRLPGRGSAQTVLPHPCFGSTVKNTLQTFLNHRPPVSSEQLDIIWQISAFLDAEVANIAEREDPWALFYNVQVYLQNSVLKELLPQHGIAFLPLNIPWSRYTHLHGRQYFGNASHISLGTEMQRIEVIGETFLTGLHYILRFLE